MSRITDVVELCRRAALAGDPAPSNRAIASRLGFASAATASEVVGRAAAAGLIIVHRGNASRVVEAADGSWRTAGMVRHQHWRDRRKAGSAPEGEGAAAHAADWTAEEDAEVLRMVRAGRSTREVGARLGRSREAVRSRLQRLRAMAVPGGTEPGPVAQPIPAAAMGAAGVPARAGHPEAVAAGCGDGSLDVGSLKLPPAVEAPRPGGLLGSRTCRWPIGEPGTSGFRFCEAETRRRRDGVRCVYCAEHAARAFTRLASEAEAEDAPAPPHRITRSTFAWGGRAA